MTDGKERLRAQLATCSDDEAVALLAAAHSDDAADLLADLPDARRDALMQALPERQRRRVAVLAGDTPATAGSLMSSDFLAFYGDATAAHALDRIRTSGLDAQATAVVFVANVDRQLYGTVTFKDLLNAPPETPLSHLMRPNPEKLRTDASFEEVARLVTDFDLLAAPIVNDEHHIVGVISADDVLEVMMPNQWRRVFRPERS